MQSHPLTVFGRATSTLHDLWLGTPGWVLYLAAILGAAAWLAASMNRPVARVDLAISSMEPESGYAYLAEIGRPQGALPIFSPVPDSAGRPAASDLALYEADRPLGPAHSLHDQIRHEGNGRYSHWGDHVFFSSSDNTDPRTNGRTYSAVYPSSTAPWFDAASFLLVLIAFLRAFSKQGSRILRVFLFGCKSMLDPAFIGRRGPWVWFVLGIVTVGIVWLYIFRLWWTGETVDLSVAGIFPVSDSIGYQSCAREIVDLGHTSSWCHRRPIYASFFASLWALSGRHLEITQLLQAAILMACILPFAKEATRWLGFGAALMIALGVSLWAQKHAFAISMSENIGLALGLLALTLLLNAAGRGRLAIAHLGLAVLTLALHARAGAFFALPFLVLWIGYMAHKGGKSFFLHSTLAVLSVGCVTIINSALVSSIGGELFGSHGNFAWTLYGLSVGGDWSTAIDQHPELAAYSGKEYFDQVYRLALENISNDPTVLFLSLLKNAGGYHRWVLFDYANGPIRGALWLAWVSGFFLSAVFARSDPRTALLLAITLGEMASAPLIAGDGGARLFAATSGVQPVLAAYAVIKILQMTAFSHLYASFPAAEVPGGRPRAAYTMLAVLGVAIALPHSPVRKALAETPVAGIEACKKSYETVVATLHRNAVVLTVRGDTFPNRLWPIRVHYGQLAEGFPDNSWFKSDFRFDTPIQIIQTGQLLEDDFARSKLLFWTGREELPLGSLVRLCVGIVSFTKLD
jgi:hypothetical protein